MKHSHEEVERRWKQCDATGDCLFNVLLMLSGGVMTGLGLPLLTFIVGYLSIPTGLIFFGIGARGFLRPKR
jgi:hypothetical protein